MFAVVRHIRTNRLRVVRVLGDKSLVLPARTNEKDYAILTPVPLETKAEANEVLRRHKEADRDLTKIQLAFPPLSRRPVMAYRRARR